jgi:carboxyl-terminal processing protease
MKFKGLQLIVSTTAAIVLCSYILYETGERVVDASSEIDRTKDKVLLDVLVRSIENSHFEPKPLNDQFSEDVYNLYLKRLDYNKRFLLQSDVDKLSEFKTKIDDQIKAGNYTFFDLTNEILRERVGEIKEFYQEILDKPFDFSINETIDLDEENREFQKNKKDLKAFWHKSLKYEALTRIHDQERKQEKASEDNDTLTILSFDEMEAKARKNMLKSNDRFFDRMEKWTRDDLKEIYLNSITAVYGPHTGYFPPKDKANFDISMSGQLEGIGAQLQERDGFIRVSSIVPGSPSYLQGELEEGDLILKVSQENGAPVDITDTRIDEAVKLIRGKKGTKVILTIKKLNGLIKDITIVRDVVVLEETYAKSAVIENDGVRVGYIKLPKFYADFNKSGGRSAADDVEKEIAKLKTEKVDGIILDLRGNGGGSLRDAIEMTGHFIEQGPVVQVKGRYTPAEVMKDNDKTVSYDGPLVVMINQFSASASEILAAAIQDYDRGIILGSSSSFGKGTVQRFFELDRYLTAGASQYRPLGAVKITTQKFYRINGDATQLKGVESDIVVPTQYAYFDMGEKEQEFVMPWDEIDAVDHSIWKPKYNESEVISKSQERIRSNELFKKIDENAKLLKSQTDETIISLNYDSFSSKQAMLDAQDDAYEQIMKDAPVQLDVKNLQVDVRSFEADSVKTEINEKWLKNLKKDVTLEEAVFVIKDLKG